MTGKISQAVLAPDEKEKKKKEEKNYPTPPFPFLRKEKPMLIFNRTEIENSFKENDNEIVQIESRLSFREFLQKLQNTYLNKDGGLNENDFDMHVFRSGRERTAEIPQTNTDSFDNELYHHTYNPGEESGLDEVETKRDPLYSEFERFTYGQNHDFAEIPVDDILEDRAVDSEYNLPTFYKDMLDSAGVMPTLYDTDVPIKQLQDMSYMGKQLYFSWKPMDRSNRMPTEEDLTFFYNLNPYERAVITDSLHCPTRLLDTLEALRRVQGLNRIAVTESMIEHIRELTPMDANELVAELTPINEAQCLDADADNYTALKDAFVAKFRRAPRVLPEIYEAYLKAFHVTSLTDEQIAAIVDGFKLNNIGQVAPLHNEMLYLLSAEMNFSETKAEHLQIFATYLIPEDWQYLKDSHFLEWYDRYKSDIKISDLCNIVRNIKSLHFDLELPPKKVLRLATQVRGWCNAACVNEEYGIDFRNAVVAIPGRGLVVEDKPQKIRMYILDHDDARIFTVGQDCHCCQNLAVYGDQTYGNYYSGAIMEELLAQHFTNIDDAYAYVHENVEHLRELNYYGGRLISGGAGASCVANELTHPLAWVTIWEDSVTGNTIAQADTHYVADTNTLVYDNIEFVNDGNVKKLYDIIATYAENSDFTSIHIGTGYNQGMKSFGKHISTREFQHYAEDITDEFKEKFSDHLYSDYHASDAVKIKQNGEMLIFSRKPASAFNIIHEEEDNEQYRYLTDPVAVLFKDYTLEQKQDLVARYAAQNLTTEELVVIAEKKPQLLADFEVLPIEAQRKILFGEDGEINMEGFAYIRYPDSLLLSTVLSDHPEAVMYFDKYSVPQESWMDVVKADGSLIEYCPDEYLTEDLLTEAIKNNPYCIKYIADRIEEPLKSRMIIMAVYKRPILAAHFPQLPEYVWVHICERKGQFGRYCPNQTYRVQKAMIQSSVYNIDNIRHPDSRILASVAQILPNIRTNPRYARYFGNDVALENTQSHIRESVPANESSLGLIQPSERTTLAAALHDSQSELDDAFSMEDLA